MTEGVEIRFWVPNWVFFIVIPVGFILVLALRRHKSPEMVFLLPDPKIIKDRQMRVKSIRKRWIIAVSVILTLMIITSLFGWIKLDFGQVLAQTPPVLDWQEPVVELPLAFVEQVRLLGPAVTRIALEENVPPAVPFVLWLKEHGGQQNNPSNGEGICGFYDLRVSGQDYFPPGEISDEELLRQLRLCAQEFKRRSLGVTFETTDMTVLGNAYMRYNGNIDCYGNPFSGFMDHPYVMNGWDESHMSMIARDGLGGCVAMRLIGALPAHYRVAEILQQLP